MLKINLRYTIALISISLLACGGGGGGGSSKSAATSAPFSYDQIQWQDRSTEHYFPTGVVYRYGQFEGSTAHWLSIDLSNEKLALEAIKADGAQAIFNYTFAPNVVAAINGGFFSGNSSYSAVINKNTVHARNVTSLNRNNQSYPVLRSAFILDQNNQASVKWIYQFDLTSDSVYSYNNPLAYTSSASSPLPTPQITDGTQITPNMAIGGGPTLVKGGVEKLTYNEEIFWGSGVELNDLRPRSAICVTADQLTFLVAVTQMKLSAMPSLLISMGCVDAMNLDGGGSTAMAFTDKAIYDQGRAVPTAVVVVEKP